jgi:hypothetical protein
MSEHPVVMRGTRQLSIRLTLLATTLFALSLLSNAQVPFVPNLPPDPPQNSRNVPRPPSRSDQVWQFKSGAVPLNTPQKLYQCEAGQCGTWVFNGATGEGQWPHGGAVAELTIEKFDFDGIIIHRRDVRGNTPGLTALYTGKIVGNQIKGEVTWTWSGFGGRSPHTVWGATVQAPAGYSILDLNLPCKSYAMSAEEALYRGSEAIDAKRYSTGICWLRIAADKGNPEAEGVLAVIYYHGYQTPRNFPEAIKYAQAGAAAGNSHAEGALWRMYDDGTLPKDPAKAKYWEAKFKADKATADEALEARMNEELAFQKEALHIQNVNETAMIKRVQQAQRDQNIATTVMLGLFLGALVEGIGGSSGSPDGDFEQNRRDSLDRGCRSGDSYACYQQDPLSSDNDH